MEIVNLNIEDLTPYEKNAKRHPQEQVDQIADSIRKFGMNDPIGVWGDKNIIVEGHGRYLACKFLGIKEVPCVRLDNLTDAERKEYTLIHNKTTMNSGFEDDILQEELAWIYEHDKSIDMSKFDFALNLDEEENEEAVEDDYDGEGNLPEEPVAQFGDIYQLGEHRLMCGDSTNKENVERLMGGELADLLFTDPPYGMKKEGEGVVNDNLNFDDLLEFNKKWIPLSFAHLKDNGSWYCWGIDEPLMDIYSNILKPMEKANKITFRNIITWKKENDNPTMIFNGACASDNRSYFTNEKCLFVMCGVQGFNTNSDNYFEGWEPVRQYLAGEAEKVGLTSQKLQEICGVGMYSHWFGKSQFAFITEEHYKELQNYYSKNDAFKKEYDAFKKEYDELKKEYYSTRAYFDPNGGQCIDVWVHDVTSQKERELTGGHATPKPIALCARGIKSSCQKDGVVLDLFGGSGSTLIACEQLGRKCRMMEFDRHWVDVIIDRWQTLTGKKAVKLN